MNDLSLTAIFVSLALGGSVAAYVAAGAGNAVASENAMAKIADRWVAENTLVGLSASCAVGQHIYSAVAGAADAALETELTNDHSFQIGTIAVLRLNRS